MVRVGRVVLLASYDGSGFHGFANQPGQRTVQGSIEAALERMTGGAVSTVCAGRTDTGVHALCQVVHADLPEEYLLRRGSSLIPFSELGELARSLSKQVAPDAVIWRSFVAPEGFDARHSALGPPLPVRDRDRRPA